MGVVRRWSMRRVAAGVAWVWCLVPWLGKVRIRATGGQGAVVRIALRSVYKRAHGWERRECSLWCVVGGCGGLGWASMGYGRGWAPVG